MFYRHKDFGETFVHQCSNAHKYTEAHRREIANVRKHDVAAYLSVPVRTYSCHKFKELHGYYPVERYEEVRITHCPYCGANLDTDEISGEYLDLKLE